MPMQYVWFGLLGLVAGVLGGQLLRGHYNVYFDIALGVAGALLGGHLFLTYGAVLGVGAGLTPGLVFAAIGTGVFLLGWRAVGSVE